MYYILGSCLNEQFVCLYISLGMKFSLMYVKEPCLWLLLAHNSLLTTQSLMWSWDPDRACRQSQSQSHGRQVLLPQQHHYVCLVKEQLRGEL